MLLDFILLLSATLTVIKLGLRNYITGETAAILLCAFVFFLASVRIMGSEVFRQKSRILRLFVSLALFAYGIAEGNVEAAVLVAALVIATALAPFGLYVMFSGLFPREKKRR